MTNQETFDKVVAGIRAQGGPALKDANPGLACAYRTPEGKKCAAGVLIADEHYDFGMEAEGLLDTTGNGPVGAYLKNLGYDLYFIALLQSVHDSTALNENTRGDFMTHFLKKCVTLARDHGLDPAAAL